VAEESFCPLSRPPLRARHSGWRFSDHCATLEDLEGGLGRTEEQPVEGGDEPLVDQAAGVAEAEISGTVGINPSGTSAARWKHCDDVADDENEEHAIVENGQVVETSVLPVSPLRVSREGSP
jgi:hypothetical protein